MNALLLGLLYSGFKNFRGVDLSELDLSDLDLSGCDFSGAIFRTDNISNTNFSMSNFDAAKFKGCDLENCNFSVCSFRETIFCEIIIGYGRSQYPVNTKIKTCDFTASYFDDGAFFDHVDLSKCDFSGSILGYVSFIGSELGRADFKDALLMGARFYGTEVWCSRFSGSIFDDCHFMGAVFVSCIDVLPHIPKRWDSFTKDPVWGMHSSTNVKHRHCHTEDVPPTITQYFVDKDAASSPTYLSTRPSVK